jgi:hypothetical protein
MSPDQRDRSFPFPDHAMSLHLQLTTHWEAVWWDELPRRPVSSELSRQNASLRHCTLREPRRALPSSLARASLQLKPVRDRSLSPFRRWRIAGDRAGLVRVAHRLLNSLHGGHETRIRHDRTSGWVQSAKRDVGQRVRPCTYGRIHTHCKLERCSIQKDTPPAKQARRHAIPLGFQEPAGQRPSWINGPGIHCMVQRGSRC